MLKKTFSKSRLSPDTLDTVKMGVMLPGRAQARDQDTHASLDCFLSSAIVHEIKRKHTRNYKSLNGSCAHYFGDWANCWAAVTASSVLPITMGTLLQPGCFKTRSNCRTVRSTVARVQRSTLLITIKMGTFRAMASPRCSRVVPAGKEKGRGSRMLMSSEKVDRIVVQVCSTIHNNSIIIHASVVQNTKDKLFCISYRGSSVLEACLRDHVSL